jgi:hypothetical protein
MVLGHSAPLIVEGSRMNTPTGTLWKVAWPLVLSVALSACGGGGDGGGTSSPPQAAPCGSVTDIALASSTNGTLATGDCTQEALFPGLGDQSFVDQYRITLPYRGTLSIRMNSNQFDTFLVLLNSPLQLPEIATDDDSGGGTNALISLDLDAGTYIILGPVNT